MLAFPKTGDIFCQRYRLLELLGSGGLGSVFKAEQIDSGRKIALKILHPREETDAEEFRQRFLREAKALIGLEHSDIVAVYHVGISDNGFAYMAMELLKGTVLRQVMEDEVRDVTKELLLRDKKLADKDARVAALAFFNDIAESLIDTDLKEAEASIRIAEDFAKKRKFKNTNKIQKDELARTEKIQVLLDEAKKKASI